MPACWPSMCSCHEPLSCLASTREADGQGRAEPSSRAALSYLLEASPLCAFGPPYVTQEGWAALSRVAPWT